MPRKPSDPVFPPEIWSHVMHYCSARVLKCLAIVSHSCHNESQKHLYHTVVFNEVPETRPSVPATQIRDLARFLANITGRSDQLCAVKNARFSWRNGLQFGWDAPAPEVDSHRLLSQLIQNTARKLASFETLKTLHISLPRLDSAVPFNVPWISSLTVPITGSMHEDPDFATLLKLFQIPSVHEMELDSIVRLNCKVPQNCRQPGTSNVRRLRFTYCGPVHGEISHLLSWPKDLQVLQFFIAIPRGCHRYAYDSGSISMTGILNALWPIKNTIKDLRIDIDDYSGAMPDEPLQETAFELFGRLRRLHIPLEMLMQFSDDEYFPPPYDVAPPIHTHLPSTLEELILDVEQDLPWFDWDNQGLPSKEAKELFTWLSGLAYYKSRLFTDLRLVEICRNASWIKPTSHPSDFPLHNDHTQKFMDLMQSAGLSMIFS